MVWLNVTDENGSALYFDVEKVEKTRIGKRGGYSLSGTIGNGQYEGEVLVDIGEVGEVVFVDQWLGDDGFSAFNRQVDIDEVRLSIIEVAASFESGWLGAEAGAQRQGDHRYGEPHSCPRVKEDSVCWTAVA